jgi:hypothetical protein
MGGRMATKVIVVRGFVATFIVVASVLIIGGCQELRDEELDPTPPDPENIPPFLVSAPDVHPGNHATGYQRLDCVTCHTTRLIRGHADFPQERCVKCHGYNGSPAFVGCGECHDVPNAAGFPISGLHDFHVSEKAFTCDECHANNTHRNGGLDISLKRGGAFYRDISTVPGDSGVFAGEGCSDVGCHEARAWKEGACETCHESPPSGPSHELHLAVRGSATQPALTCRDCHADNEHDDDLTSGAIDVGGPEWIDWQAYAGSCETTCHGAEEKVWTCDTCHGFPPEVGAHRRHAVELVLQCEICHSNHEHSSEAVADPLNQTGKVEISFLFERGRWDPLTRTCFDVGCHADWQWP